MDKVFSFSGADHKCGTSMAAQSTAQLLAREDPVKKVLLLGAHYGPGMPYAKDIRESMENIRPYMADRIFDMDEIVRKALWRENLWVIGSADKPGTAGLYHPDMAAAFIDRLKDHFDIIICDCGAEIENGLALGCLLRSDMVFLVISQSETALRRWEWLAPLYEKLGLKPDKYLINRYSSGSEYSFDYMAKRLPADPGRLITVRDSSKGLSAEGYGKSILDCRDSRYKRDMQAAAELIKERQGI